MPDRLNSEATVHGFDLQAEALGVLEAGLEDEILSPFGRVFFKNMGRLPAPHFRLVNGTQGRV